MKKISIFLILFRLHPLWAVDNTKSCSRTAESGAYQCTSMYQTKIEQLLKQYVTKESVSSFPITLKLQKIEFIKINNIEKITPIWFNVNVFVGYLVLKELKIEEIETDAFNEKQFEKMWRLDINSAPLEILNKGAFNGLTNLRYLSFAEVRLRHFAEKLFQPLFKLQILVMLECGPHKISLDNLFGHVAMRHLKQVTISHCILADTITRVTFWGLRNIETLELVSNQIGKIGPNSFDIVLNTLTKLSLIQNDLSTLPKNLFLSQRSYSNITSINLKYNEWHCDCGMEHIRRLVQSNSNLEFSEIICATPKEFAKQDLKYLSSLCDDSDYENDIITSDDRDDTSPSDEHAIVNAAVEWNNFIAVRCKKKNITIARPSLNMSPVKLRKRKLSFNTENIAKYNFMIMYYDQDHILDDRSSCLVHNSNREIQNEHKVEPNKLHRVCWKPKNLRTIIPMNCVTIRLKESDAENTVWILREQMAGMIVICIFSTVGSFLIGMFVAYVWAKIFQKKPLPLPKPSLKKTLSERMRQQEMIDRLKESDKPFRRRFSSKWEKLTSAERIHRKKFVLKKTSHRIGASTGVVLPPAGAKPAATLRRTSLPATSTGSIEIPPPLPPRKRANVN